MTGFAGKVSQYLSQRSKPFNRSHALAEELGDVNQAKKFIDRGIIQELSAEYFKSMGGGKNDIYEQLNQGFKYRFIFRNDDQDWGFHLDVKQNDLIRE